MNCKNDLLGTPETSLRGLRTLMALRVLRSTLSCSASAPGPASLPAAEMIVMNLRSNYYKTLGSSAAA